MSARDTLRFLTQFVRFPRTIGAIAPSSAQLANSMVDWIDWSTVHNVAEYGPGTGVFTEVILQSKRPDARYLGIEINAAFAAKLRVRFPTASIFNDSVANVDVLCRKEGIDQLDAIICGLPWASLKFDQQSRYMSAMMSVLRPQGKFATFAYLQGLLLPAGQRFRRTLRSQFSSAETSPVVWRNMPPAFVYRCSR